MHMEGSNEITIEMKSVLSYQFYDKFVFLPSNILQDSKILKSESNKKYFFYLLNIKS